MRAQLLLCMSDAHSGLFVAIQCGVPVVPGTPGPVGSYEEGDAFIKEYGFPGEPDAHVRARVVSHCVQSSSRPPWAAAGVACV